MIPDSSITMTTLPTFVSARGVKDSHCRPPPFPAQPSPYGKDGDGRGGGRGRGRGVESVLEDEGSSSVKGSRQPASVRGACACG